MKTKTLRKRVEPRGVVSDVAISKRGVVTYYFTYVISSRSLRTSKLTITYLTMTISTKTEVLL